MSAQCEAETFSICNRTCIQPCLNVLDRCARHTKSPKCDGVVFERWICIPSAAVSGNNN